MPDTALDGQRSESNDNGAIRFSLGRPLCRNSAEDRGARYAGHATATEDRDAIIARLMGKSVASLQRDDKDPNGGSP